MLVTLLGIVIEVRPLQPRKASCPMLVTLLGIVTEVRPLQFSVFANRFISEIYFLNGRKVVTLILQKTKNGKI